MNRLQNVKCIFFYFIQVAYISRQRVVGVAWEGIKVGRFGKLCLIQVNISIALFSFIYKLRVNVLRLCERWQCPLNFLNRGDRFNKGLFNSQH